MSEIAFLPERGVVEVTGIDRVSFLQGLVSNDVTLAAPGRAVWAALLTPQGKWLADFFILSEGDRLLLDCERAQAPMLVKLLSRYRLRAKATLRDASEEFAVHAAWGGVPSGGIVGRDERLPEAGWRVLDGLPRPDAVADSLWHAHRIALGLPDGSRDMEAEKSILLEAGFDELSGVSWSKGCYMGQELTARTKYRGLVKRRLMRVSIEGPMPASGTAVLRGGQDVGVLRSHAGDQALAVLRIDALREGPPLTCGDFVLTPHPSSWMKLPESV
jgi:folate-binding protein YgfZ